MQLTIKGILQFSVGRMLNFKLLFIETQTDQNIILCKYSLILCGYIQDQFVKQTITSNTNSGGRSKVVKTFTSNTVNNKIIIITDIVENTHVLLESCRYSRQYFLAPLEFVQITQYPRITWNNSIPVHKVSCPYTVQYTIRMFGCVRIFVNTLCDDSPLSHTLKRIIFVFVFHFAVSGAASNNLKSCYVYRSPLCLQFNNASVLDSHTAEQYDIRIRICSRSHILVFVQLKNKPFIDLRNGNINKCSRRKPNTHIHRNEHVILIHG